MNETFNLQDMAQKALDFYGFPDRKIKACEELSELSAVLMRTFTREVTNYELASEIADVYILLESIRALVPEPYLNHVIQIKLAALALQMEKDKVGA